MSDEPADDDDVPLTRDEALFLAHGYFGIEPSAVIEAIVEALYQGHRR